MIECVIILMVALRKDAHGGILVMYSSKEKMRGIFYNYSGVIMLLVKKKPMFEKPDGRWREDVVAKLLSDSSFIIICNFQNNGITMLVFSSGM